MYSLRISQIVNGQLEIKEESIEADNSREAFLKAIGEINPNAINVRIHIRRL